MDFYKNNQNFEWGKKEYEFLDNDMDIDEVLKTVNDKGYNLEYFLYIYNNYYNSTINYIIKNY